MPHSSAAQGRDVAASMPPRHDSWWQRAGAIAAALHPMTTDSAEWKPAPAPPCDYTAGYLDHEGDQLYYVHHRAHGAARAKVLALGPFANERTCSAMVWRRWACRMADAGYEVLRFDYRGVGESSGDFQKLGFHDWMEDALRALAHLRGDDASPIFLHGLRLGALLGSHLLSQGRAAALLMWDPPQSGREMLMQALRARLAIDMVLDPGAPPATREQYVQALERGEFVDVEGFRWGKRLWESAAEFTLQIPREEGSAFWVVHLDKRPATRVAVAGRSDVIPIPIPPFWQMGPNLDPDLKRLMERSLELLDDWVAPREGSS
jgi:pimeloyl-ACP methyl ester carboxylesterase